MVKLPSEPDQKLVIAAIGEAGEGKSTLLNLILNSPGEDKTYFDVSQVVEFSQAMWIQLSLKCF